MQGMKLQTADIMRLLPYFMREDDANNALASGVNPLIHALYDGAVRLQTWDKLEVLTEPELDKLALELNIAWYNDTADRETKIQLIKDSDLVYSRLGTKWAVERVVNTYFGSGEVEEWFEYGGKPYFFRIKTTNADISYCEKAGVFRGA